MNRSALLLTAVLIFFSAQLSAQTIELFADINPTGSGFPARIANLNGELVFSGATSGANRELMGSDGTNVYLIQEINPGTTGSNPGYMIPANGKLYFFATEAFSGREIWSYDGNQVQMFYESIPGASNVSYTSFNAFNGIIYIAMDLGTGLGSELYAFDGVNPPTLVADINLANGGGSNILKYIEFDNKLHFVATDSADVTNIWSYDGVNPAVQVTNFAYPLNNTFDQLTVFNNKLHFTYYDPNENPNHQTLYEYDGTNPAVPVMNAYSGIEPFDAQNLTVYNNKLYMTATDSIVSNFQMWQYDGTTVPTQIYESFADAIEYNGSLYLRYNTPLYGLEIHRFDGVNPPVLVEDFNPGTNSITFDEATLFDNRIFFRNTESATGTELYVLDCNSDSSTNVVACNSYTAPSGAIYTTNGIYQDTIANHLGCDSVLTIDLSLYTLVLTVAVQPFNLTSNATGLVDYQWIDCTTGQPIVGATNQTYTMTSNGSYAVIIDNGNCSDTSDCIVIDALGIDDLQNQEVILFPNPASEQLSVKSNGIIEEIEIINLAGIIVVQQNMQSTQAISIGYLASGSYVVKINTAAGTHWKTLQIYH